MPLSKKTLSDIITVSRNSVETAFTAAGNIKEYSANEARIDYDPVTGSPLGILVEEERTNYLLNSQTLSTQTVAVGAQQYTFSFYGTGQVILSGAYNATLNGAGSFPTRTICTFLASAGNLTLTVVETVQYAQLEVGGFETSWIPTTSVAVTRYADATSFAVDNWYNKVTGTFVIKHDPLVNVPLFNSGDFNLIPVRGTVETVYT